MCSNLAGFFCSPNILPSFLLTLTAKDRLKDLRINASLTTEQSELLIRLKGLRSILLDRASWCIMNLLPMWMGSLSSTLTHLTVTVSPSLDCTVRYLSDVTIQMSSELNGVVLESTLSQLPNLLGLSILSCSKIDHSTVLKLVSHTPRLESLAFTTWVSRPCPIYFAQTLHSSISTRSRLSRQRIHMPTYATYVA